MEIDRARPGDVPPVAHIFSQAFVSGTASDSQHLAAVEDIFGFLLESEPDSLLIARGKSGVLGYCMVVTSMRRLWRFAFSRRYLLRWASRFLKGEYGPMGYLWRILADKVCFAVSPHNYRAGCAQILSIAVREAERGGGIGRNLLEAGLKHLRSSGVKEVKLEVRPENTHALSLYDSMGFRRVGTLRDTRGLWYVMVKAL